MEAAQFHVGDEIPVDLEVDGILQGLLDGGAFAPGVGAAAAVDSADQVYFAAKEESS